MSLPPALLQLRAGTQADHARMEALPRMRAVRGDAASLEGYAELLALFYGYHEPIERRLAASSAWARHGFDFQARRKLALIARDLRHLGWSEAAIAALPRHTPPDLPCDGAALGCLYVLEGATLGAQLLARHVAERLGLGADSGAAFFTGYGEAVGPMWREFCALVVAHSGPDQIDPAVVAGARATFAGMADWLSRPALTRAPAPAA